MKKVFVIVLCLLLQSCNSIKAIDRPKLSLQDRYAGQEVQTLAIDVDWWKSFSSQALNQLIDQALKNSPDLKMASERVVQAQLALSSADGELYPSVNLTASTGDTRSRPSGGDWSNNESSRLGLNASYEIDFWGRVAASRASAKASFKVQQYDYQTARLTLIGSVATLWFEYLAAEENLALAQKSLTLAEKTYQLNQVMYQNGAIAETDLVLSENALLEQQAALIPLKFAVKQYHNSLAILLGETPNELNLPQEALFTLIVPDIKAGVPADLLIRRPDLASSEASLSAADADVAIARANMLPSVQIGASIGRAAAKLFSLDNGTDSIGISGTLTQAIFAHGQLKNQYKISQSKQISLLEGYRKTILTALKEASEAVTTVQLEKQKEDKKQAVEQALKANVEREQVSLEQGQSSQLDVLVRQKSHLQAQQSLVSLRQARLIAAVDLYKALGGGWQAE